MLEKLIAIK